MAPVLNAEELFLKNNLQKSQPGDFIVVSSYKTDTLMHIYAKQENLLTIEEISIPEGIRCKQKISWREWVEQNAPGNKSWVMYEIDLTTAQMLRYYSFTKNGWFEIPDADNFLCKLLNLRLTKISDKARKRIGPVPNSGPDLRSIWQPQMVVDGHIIKNVSFDAWRTKWPKDSSDLTGKNIEIYLPQDHQAYPSYFPYWLQINGVVGKAKVRIIDSGRQLKSPKPPLGMFENPRTSSN